MPTAPVDDRGTVLYYEDTGAPEGSSTYLTVVLVHGLLFHGSKGPRCAASSLGSHAQQRYGSASSRTPMPTICGW